MLVAYAASTGFTSQQPRGGQPDRSVGDIDVRPADRIRASVEPYVAVFRCQGIPGRPPRTCDFDRNANWLPGRKIWGCITNRAWSPPRRRSRPRATVPSAGRQGVPAQAYGNDTAAEVAA